MSRRLAHTWATALLLLYPRAFRARFGGEMRTLILARLAEAARRGGAAAGAFICTCTFNTMREAAGERARALSAWRRARHDADMMGQRHKGMLMDTLRADVRHAVRLGLKTPLFTAIAVLTLALGIGANSAIFAVVNGVLLKPLAYRAPDRLVMLWSHNTRENRAQNPLSPANFADFRDRARTLSNIDAFVSFLIPNQLVTEAGTEGVTTMQVGPTLFSTLGRDALLGRTLTPSDTDAVVLSYGFWQRRFGGDPAVIGRHIGVGGQQGSIPGTETRLASTIVGVMPPDFTFPYGAMLGATGFTRASAVDMWLPMPLRGERFTDAGGALVRNVHFLGAIARLAPETSVEQARSDLQAIAADMEREHPGTNKGWSATVVPLHEQVVGSVRPALLVLLGGVGLVLLMACVNVANLMLARSVGRQQELSLRVALGASRGRLFQQALTESLLLSVAGGVASLLVAQGGVRALLALAPADLPRLADVGIDWQVVSFTIAIAVVMGALVGLAPALAQSRPDLRGALQESARGGVGASPARRRLRAALVVGEIALAVVLTIGAGLLLRSFTKLLAVDPGFTPDRLLTLQLNVPARLATPDARRAFYQDFFARMQALPGVTAVGGTTRLPLGSTNVSTTIAVEGRNTPQAELPEVEFRRALHNYFTAMGIPILRGRGFTAEDNPNAPPVAVINQTMARRIFGDADPLGMRIRNGPSDTAPWMTIVGVIGDVRHSGLEAAPAPEMYVNYLQNPPVAPFMVFRTLGDPAALAELVRAEARAIDPSMPLFDIRTMMRIRSESVAERRFTLLLVGLFGVLALTLAASGVYGVMALIVSERTGEMGLRMALGAEPTQMLRMVIAQALKLAVSGIVVGLAIAAVVTPLLANQLFGIGALDLTTFLGVPLVLVTVAALAALFPAARAMRLDPVTALRHT